MSLLGLAAAPILNFTGAIQANQANRKIAKEQMKFQRESNLMQMDFQERMSNTAYQRAMQDMRDAGLNPILAFNQGGASTPAGSASGGATTTMQNTLSGAVSSALDYKRVNAEIENLKAQNKNLQEMNEQIKSQTRLNDANTGLAALEQQMEYTKLPGMRYEQALDEHWWGRLWRGLQRALPGISSGVGAYKAIKPKPGIHVEKNYNYHR